MTHALMNVFLVVSITVMFYMLTRHGPMVRQLWYNWSQMQQVLISVAHGMRGAFTVSTLATSYMFLLIMDLVT